MLRYCNVHAKASKCVVLGPLACQIYRDRIIKLLRNEIKNQEKNIHALT